MTREVRFVLGVATKAYVAVAIAYCVYVWMVGPYAGTASLRTAVAVIAFGLCVWLPERFSKNPYAVPLLEVFGVLGTTVMVSVIHTQGTQ